MKNEQGSVEIGNSDILTSNKVRKSEIRIGTCAEAQFFGWGDMNWQKNVCGPISRVREVFGGDFRLPEAGGLPETASADYAWRRSASIPR